MARFLGLVLFLFVAACSLMAGCPCVARRTLLLDLPEQQGAVVAQYNQGASTVTVQGTDNQLSGETAIAALSSSAELATAVADSVGMSVAQLTQMLARDRSLALNPQVRALVFRCPAPTRGVAEVLVTESGSAYTSAAADQSEPPIQDAFRLHSRPGSSRVIYLDFDGHVTTGSAWLQGRTINTPPYSLDADPAFSDAELASIVSIWRAVAEDFSAFDVDVTTEYPDSEQKIDVRAAIGGKSEDWYGPAIGGVAFVGAFGNSFYSPAFIFAGNLAGGVAKFVAEAVSHEVGHTMGLLHDGDASSAYYSGSADPNSHFAPIMGVGYYKPITQWSKGEYPGATNTQDDTAIIRAALGGRKAPTDSGSSLSTAWPMTVTDTDSTTSTAVMRGVVDDPQVPEFFSLQAGGAGLLTAVASVIPSSEYVRANLDLVLTLYDSGGRVLSEANPDTALAADRGHLGASIILQLPGPGTYYLSIRSTGSGDPATGGYSAYGSIGQYALQATYPADPVAGLVPPPALPPRARDPPASAPNPIMSAAIVGMISRKSKDNARTMAYASLRVRDAATGKSIKGAKVTGRWSFWGRALPGWPYDVTMTTTSRGTANTRSRLVPATGVGTYTFTITNVAAPDRAWDGVKALRGARVR